jgi:carboxyl-terminal processing protease
MKSKMKNLISLIKENRQTEIFVVVEILVILTAFFAGIIFQRYRSVIAGKFSILQESFDLLHQYALGELPTDQVLEYGMVRGMLQTYNDPYTVFLEPPQNELQTNQLEGRFGGVGARIERDTQNNLLIYPFPGSPSEKAGILEGDQLLKIDDLEITLDTPMDNILAAIRGPVGGIVKLTVARAPDYIAFEVEVTREEVALPSVTWNIAPEDSRVGIIQVNIIAETTPDEVTTAITDLEQKGASHFILDLRNNSGGLVDAGVKLAGLFLPQGVVIDQQYRGKDIEQLSNNQEGQYSNLPMVVLVNHGSASAAEIVAGALQGQKRALLIGSPTYGKNTIQLVFNLKDGSSLHVTSAHWWVPELGQTPAGTGLQPDVLLTEDEANQPQIIQIAIQKLFP